MFLLHLLYTYSACSDQSKKSGARHQDLPLRVSQDIIGEETTSTIHAIIELLQHSTVQYFTHHMPCFLFLIFLHGYAVSDSAVEVSSALRCTHYDAFRFFHPSAQPLNSVSMLTRDFQLENEQPGMAVLTITLFFNAPSPGICTIVLDLTSAGTFFNRRTIQ